MTERPSRHEEISLIAYGIWEQEGRPKGKEAEHWLLAEKIWEERQKALAATTARPRTVLGRRATPRTSRVSR